MKRLWVLLIIAFVLATVLFVPLVGHHRRKVSGMNPGNFQNKPTRIVSLSPNLTEILFVLGLGDRVVAVSNNCDWPPEAKTKPKVGTFWQPNTEAIIAARPDLVVCESFEQQRTAAETLKRTGLNVLMLRVESIEELFSAITKIGQATGCSATAEQLAENIKSQLDQIRTTTSSSRKVKVLWIMQPEPLRVAGVNTFVNEIIKLAGGQNAIGPTIDRYPSIGTEEILSCGAEVIMQSAMGTEDIHKQQIAAEQFWSRFTNLPAVKDKRIYIIDADTVLRLGPRLPQGLQTTAQCLHPELFAQPQEPNRKTEYTDG